MDAFEDAKDLELIWSQPGVLKRQFVLRSGERLFAQLDFDSAFNPKAIATSYRGQWTFNRPGFLSHDVIVKTAGIGSDVAIYKPRWTGIEGNICLVNGEVYLWKVANFWSTRHSIKGKDGIDLVIYQSSSVGRKLSDLFKQQARVMISPQAWELTDLPLLIILGWYLAILQHGDSAATATTASVAVLN